jgi:TetR/AcrR family transcriptional regulator, fatty acid metabolism regulator protein
MRKREGNKEKDILEAAIKVFAEQGYYQAKIAKIAEVAGIAAGSVYLYFRNKENILERIFQDVWKKLYREFQILDQRTELELIEELNGMVDLLFSEFTANRSLAIVFINEHSLSLQKGIGIHGEYYENFLTLAEKILQTGIDNGDFDANIDSHNYTYFVFGGLRLLLRQWALDPALFPLEETQNNIKIALKNGLGTAS